jgi:isopentenyl-diphosphate delta-isomerase
LVFIYNSKGEVWLQKRPMHKKHFPGLWEISACGAVSSGESPGQAAKRETKEETGLEVDLKHVETFLNQFTGQDGHNTTRRLSHLFIAVTEEEPQPNEEVDEFRAIDRKALEKKVETDPDKYVPSFLIELEKANTAFEKIKNT